MEYIPSLMRVIALPETGQKTITASYTPLRVRIWEWYGTLEQVPVKDGRSRRRNLQVNQTGYGRGN